MRKPFHAGTPMVGLAAISLLMSTAWGVTCNQADDFNVVGTAGWGGNKVGQIQHMASGGVNGGGYLLASVSGFHLGTKNTTTWTGDYLAAGIEAVEMDLNRFDGGSDSVRVRILIFGSGGTFASRDRTPELQQGQWTHYVFGLTSNDLVFVSGGTGNLEETLAGVTTLLIRNDTESPTLPGNHPPHITGTLAIDNISNVPKCPTMNGIHRNESSLTLHVSDLTSGVTNVLQATDNPVSGGSWSNVTDVVGLTAATNVSVSIDGPAQFYRMVSP